MNRQALSPVISSLILSAAVIVVGGGIWSYANGASSVIAEGYVNDTFELLDTLTERFVVEHVSGDYEDDTVSVWIYNYGDQDINVMTYLHITRYVDGEYLDSFDVSTSEGTVIHKGQTEKIDFTLAIDVEESDRVSIKVHSYRGNQAHENYYFK